MFPSSFSNDLLDKIHSTKLLVVGAGGIGCELLKNLVLCGFEDIEVIDLDTIDVSNLNRQFLFHKKHVGKSKALVARDSVLRFNPKAKIVANHGSIISPEYGVNYFKQFSMVLNALDNVKARNYVNRLCLAAKTPLIDSGTAGYQGQVEVIQKGLSQCYECIDKPPQKTYASCTIRNHPSEHIHCTVWAKHLFNQLFGEENEEEDVSPDINDPELFEDVKYQIPPAFKPCSENGNSYIKVVDLRFHPRELFDKVFKEDIQYLLEMKDLWKHRKPPVPLNWYTLPDAIEGSSKTENQTDLKDQILWAISECRDVFTQSVTLIKKKIETLGEGTLLTWDKDDDVSMDFVASAANLRAHIFGIPLKTRFEIKAMAGNIIPAIATSNAVIAGIVTLQALKILEGQIEKCTSVYLRKLPNPRGNLIVSENAVTAPNKNCPTCSDKPEIILITDVDKMSCEEFEEEVLKKSLKILIPEVFLQSSLIISGEEGETDHNKTKTLAELQITNGSVVNIEDYSQDFKCRMFIEHSSTLENEKYKFIGDISIIVERKPVEDTNNDNEQAGSSTAMDHQQSKPADTDSDDCEMLEENVYFIDCYNSKKRKLEYEPSSSISIKKKKSLTNSDQIEVD